MRAYYTIDYEEGADSFNAIILTLGRKEIRFDTGDPLIDWFQFYRFLYSGQAKDATEGIGGSSSIDHWFMDTDTYRERYLKEMDDRYEFMTHKEIMELPLHEMSACVKCVAHKDMKSFQEVRDYYYNYVAELPLNERLKRAYVDTIIKPDESGQRVKFLVHDGKELRRPSAKKCVERVKEFFDLKI
jgi:hypothetical protein